MLYWVLQNNSPKFRSYYEKKNHNSCLKRVFAEPKYI